MNNINQISQVGKAVTTKTTFGRETSISANIETDPSIVWALLTHASDFPRWNSTIISLKGEIKAGGAIELKSTLDEKRNQRANWRSIDD